MDLPGVAVTGHQIEQVGTGDVKGPPEAESIKVEVKTTLSSDLSGLFIFS